MGDFTDQKQERSSVMYLEYLFSPRNWQSEPYQTFMAQEMDVFEKINLEKITKLDLHNNIK